MDAKELDRTIGSVLRGDRDAFRLIIRDYGLSLRGYLSSQIYHQSEVDDLAQEVFIAAYRNLKTFRRGEDFGAWLRGIARNKLYNHFRSYRRRSTAMDRFRQEVLPEIDQDLERQAAGDQSEAIAALLRCVSRLPDRMRKVVRAGLEGVKPGRLADALSTTVGAIYTLHWRANRLLRECMQKEVQHG
jgi:RNA polymerase sigma-70 factor (ECF subfamily)